MQNLRARARSLLSALERYTKTDLVYLASSGFWGNLGTLTVTAFSLALYLVFAHFVDREVFGTYQYLLAVGGILGALTFTGMNTAVTAAVARGADGSLRSAVRHQLKFAFVPFAAALLISAYYFVNGNALLGTGVLIVGALTPFMNTWNTYSAFLLGKQDFRRVFLYNFAMNVPFYGLLIAAALFTEHALVLILASFGTQALGYWLSYRRTLSVYRPGEEGEPELVRYGTHLSLMGAFGILALQADAVLAFHYLGAAGLAVYVFAVAIPERLGGLVKFLPAAALSRFATRDFATARRGVMRRLPLFAFLLLLIAGIYAFSAPFLFGLLFPTYMDAVPLSQWYALALLAALTQILVALLSAHARVRDLYVFNTVTPLLQFGFQFAGVISFGLAGLVLGRLAGIGAAFVIALLLVVLAKPASSR